MNSFISACTILVHKTSARIISACIILTRTTSVHIISTRTATTRTISIHALERKIAMSFLEYLKLANINSVTFANSFYKRLRGLLGQTKNDFGQRHALILTPCKSVHTYFMKEAIDIAFVSSNGQVLQVLKNVSPNIGAIKNKKAALVVEIFS